MAADKLQVMRKGKENYDVLLRMSDLKVYPKEKREQLLQGYEEEKDEGLLLMQQMESIEVDDYERLDQIEAPAQQGEDQTTKK